MEGGEREWERGREKDDGMEGEREGGRGRERERESCHPRKKGVVGEKR